MLQAVLQAVLPIPLHPNKSSKFINFRPAYGKISQYEQNIIAKYKG